MSRRVRTLSFRGHFKCHASSLNPQPLPGTCAQPWRKTVKAISARKPLGARWNGTFLVGSAWHMLAERENTPARARASRTGRVPLTTRRGQREQERSFRTVERDNWSRKQLASGSIGLIPSFGIFLVRFRSQVRERKMKVVPGRGISLVWISGWRGSRVDGSCFRIKYILYCIYARVWCESKVFRYTYIYIYICNKNVNSIIFIQY